MATQSEDKRLENMDKAFKVIFILGFALMVIVAILVTGNTATKPLTGSQVAAVGIIAILLLVIATLIYEQFPYSVLGKPVKEAQKEEQKV